MIETVKAALKVNEELIRKTACSIDPQLTGTLVRSPGKDRRQTYYQCQKVVDGKRKRIYLGKKDSDKVQRFVANQFRISRLELLKKNQQAMERFLQEYKKYGVPEIYAQMPGAYSDLPQVPFVDRRFQEIWDWAHEPYEKNLSKYPNAVNKSKLGERTRSKGETILHNEIIARGLPFRYDSLLELKDENGETVNRFPDYLFLCYDGSLAAIEHLGRLDKPTYAYENGEKMRIYLLNGFVLGVNLFFTSDDKDHGLDSQVADNILALVERRFYGL